MTLPISAMEVHRYMQSCDARRSAKLCQQVLARPSYSWKCLRCLLDS